MTAQLAVALTQLGVSDTTLCIFMVTAALCAGEVFGWWDDPKP